MRECMDIPAVKARFKRIEGQIRGIGEMVEKDIPCEQILIQIGAAKAALHKAGQVILEGHLHHCVVNGIQHGDAEKTLQELADAVEYFSRMV
jgi:DNA-binding FrmR family transcriptional regulator